MLDSISVLPALGSKTKEVITRAEKRGDESPQGTADENL